MTRRVQLVHVISRNEVDEFNTSRIEVAYEAVFSRRLPALRID